MATDLATLVIDVDSRSAVTAARDLRQVQNSAVGAERAATGLRSEAGRLNTALAGIGFTAVARSIVTLTKTAILTADEIANASTRIGIAADELQRFRFAAAQADLQTGELDRALRLFAQNLAAEKIATEGQDMAEAFRSFIDSIAEAPTRLEKVALAQAAFGEQWQSAMLLAEQGADEFRRQADSAFVFSDKALKAAGELDNEMRALRNAVGTGFATGLVEGFAGALDGADAGLKELNASAQAFGTAAAAAFKLATQGLVTFGGEIAENQRQTAAYIEAIQRWRDGTMSLGDVASVFMDPRELIRQMQAIQQSADFWRAAMAGDGSSSGPGLGESGIESARQQAEQEAELNRILSERQALVAALETPWARYNAQLARVNALQKLNALTAQEAARLQMMAGAQLATTYGEAIGGITGALTQLFEDNKGLAIANATINTLVGITKAFELPFPLNFAQAAAVSIAGFAQVSKIRSTNPQGGGSLGSFGGIGSGRSFSSSSGSFNTRESPIEPTPRERRSVAPSVHITLQGDGPFSREQVLRLMEEINSAVGDGARISAS